MAPYISSTQSPQDSSAAAAPGPEFAHPQYQQQQQQQQQQPHPPRLQTSHLQFTSRAAAGSSHNAPPLAKRILVPTTPDSPPGLVQANTIDPWSASARYGLGWTYFAVALVGAVVLVRLWHFWQDKIRQAIYKQQVEEYYQGLWEGQAQQQQQQQYEAGYLEAGSPAEEGAQSHNDGGFEGQHEHHGPQTSGMHPQEVSLPDTADNGPTTGRVFFPENDVLRSNEFRPQAHFSSVGFVNDTLALFRWVFYRPIPDLVWRKHRFTFSSLAVLTCVALAVVFVSLYAFLLQPLYWESIRFGAPPVAVRSGMMAVALTPWIVATATKTNILSMVMGIGPERLNVLHRWLGYLCLYLSLVHMVPFFVQPVWEDDGLSVFGVLFPPGSGIIYGSGIACFVPLAWLCVASLPALRRKAYELFVALHVPVGLVYVGMLFWHTKNFLMSWGYLWATVAILVACQVLRLRKLNWLRPGRPAFLAGDEASITLMSENCIKVTVPTQMRWKPGQYVYLRMPGISPLENHPFTISSLCSDDFESVYGEQYRDCTLVFRPYGGFTRRVLETAVAQGPMQTYRAFLDGPYGGMTRDLAAFDTCILIAGGSGITALVSQLLNLVKRMRDGKAITRKVVVVWALKRLEAMDWFREELRICREGAPPDSVTCKFFVTSAVRHRPTPRGAARALAHAVRDRLDGFVAGVQGGGGAGAAAEAVLEAEAAGDSGRASELRREDEDRITALPDRGWFGDRGPALLGGSGPQRDVRDIKDASDFKDARDVKNASDFKDVRDVKNASDFGDVKETKDAQDAKEPHADYITDTRQLKDYKKSDDYYPKDVDPASPDSTQSARRVPSFHFPALEKPASMTTPSKPPSPPLPVRAPELAHLRTTFSPPPNAAQTSNVSSHNSQRSQPLAHAGITATAGASSSLPPGAPSGFDFGFPETPTEFQKSLMRFAFPVPHQIAAATTATAAADGGVDEEGGWSVEYGRPDLGYMLRQWATGGPDGRGILGRRTAVFVCGPPAMRVGVANTVARLQAEIWGDDMLEEIYLHTENYAL
jgi:predicted ferric reductase